MKNTILRKQTRDGGLRERDVSRIRALLTHDGIPEFMIRLVGPSRLKRVPTEMVLKNRRD